MQHQNLVYRQPAQHFIFDPPDGRPSDTPVPVVQIRDGDRAVRATVGSCRVDTVATRLHGDAPYGWRTIRVESVEGIVAGGRYLMTKPEGDREWIHVTAVHAPMIELAHPLIHRYAGAATIVGCRISIAVDPAWITSTASRSDAPVTHRGLARYTLRWTYTFAGHEMTALTFADVVDADHERIVTPADVDARYAGFAAETSTRGADFIAEASRLVRLEAVGDEHAQRTLRDSYVLRELVQARANVIRLEHEVMYGRGDSGALSIAEQRYADLVDRIRRRLR